MLVQRAISRDWRPFDNTHGSAPDSRMNSLVPWLLRKPGTDISNSSDILLCKYIHTVTIYHKAHSSLQNPFPSQDRIQSLELEVLALVQHSLLVIDCLALQLQ